MEVDGAKGPDKVAWKKVEKEDKEEEKEEGKKRCYSCFISVL